MSTITTFLIICPLVFLAGFIDAIAGGGGLVSLPAYLITGLPVHNCIATNKMSSIMGTTVATTQYARNGFIPIKYAIFCVPCALIGSSLGANLALSLDDGVFKIVMLIILPLTGIYVLFKKDLSPSEGSRSFVITAFIAAIVAFTIGIYDGFYGPGTGTFIILLLTGVAKMKLEQANGLAKIINLSTNLAALTVFLIHSQVLLLLGIVAGCFNIAGSYIGVRQFKKDGTKIVRPIIILVLSIFFVKIILELFVK